MPKLLKNMSRSERKLHKRTTNDFSKILKLGLVLDGQLLEAPEPLSQTDMQKAETAFRKFIDDGALWRYNKK